LEFRSRFCTKKTKHTLHAGIVAKKLLHKKFLGMAEWVTRFASGAVSIYEMPELWGKDWQKNFLGNA